MKIFPKQSKSDRQSSDFYFGDYGEIPIGLSCATMNKDSIIEDNLHYHKKGFEFYLTISGAGIIEIEGKDVELTEERLVMVEPGEKHIIKAVVKAPFSFIAISTTKEKNDKVISDE